ncbi:MAG: mucoidy inhibitor MuiA family protein [Phaeodactylibacter sp.]|nr:mucoidy inhibitor MuiA family protein [Phaeodactylibacter sp.]MCB9051227.1 mucoidy inhibitor MuiA family protein [Lewinellaceae bacterium]
MKTFTFHFSQRRAFALAAWLFLFFPALLLAKQEPQDIPSKIVKATVFRQGAEVHREGRTSIPAGRSVLKFSGLSPSLNPQSIQFKASGNFTILSVQHQLNYLTDQQPNKEIEALTKKKDTFTQGLKREHALRQVYEEEENLLLANKQIGGQQNGVPIEGLKATADYFRTRLREVKLEKLDIDQRIEAIQDTINRLQAQLQQLNASRQSRSVSEVLVAVDAPSSLRAAFSISYLVSQAGWSPIYDLRIESVGKPVKLDYKAQVYQQSGEDWKEVELALSTGKPMSTAQRPVMDTWWLREYAIAAVPRNEMKSMEMVVVEEMEDAALTSRGVPAQGPQVQAYDQATTFEFQIQTPYDIPSDGQQYVVSIGEESLPASYEYYAAPRLNPHAFLTANVTEWEQYRLLGGPANLFFEGTYLGKSYLNPNVASDTLSFSLGIDEGIAISRKKEKQYTDRQFIGNKKTEAIGWEIELRNNKRQAVSIVIEDQYPVSTTEEIEVELEAHKGATVDKATGMLRWEVDLKPGETKTLGFRYSVKYPKRMNLVLE